jgi:hypothetical protein
MKELVVEFPDRTRYLHEKCSAVNQIAGKKHFFSLLSRNVVTGQEHFDCRYLLTASEVESVKKRIERVFPRACVSVYDFEEDYYRDHDFDIFPDDTQEIFGCRRTYDDPPIFDI